MNLSFVFWVFIYFLCSAREMKRSNGFLIFQNRISEIKNLYFNIHPSTLFWPAKKFPKKGIMAYQTAKNANQIKRKTNYIAKEKQEEK